MSETVNVKNTHLPECADCTRAYEKWCSFMEADMTCDRKQYLDRVAEFKARKERDNVKARYVALEAALRDDDTHYDIAYGGRQATSHSNDRFYGIADYRARLLALVDEGSES